MPTYVAISAAHAGSDASGLVLLAAGHTRMTCLGGLFQSVNRGFDVFFNAARLCVRTLLFPPLTLAKSAVARLSSPPVTLEWSFSAVCTGNITAKTDLNRHQFHTQELTTSIGLQRPLNHHRRVTRGSRVGHVDVRSTIRLSRSRTSLLPCCFRRQSR